MSVKLNIENWYGKNCWVRNISYSLIYHMITSNNRVGMLAHSDYNRFDSKISNCRCGLNVGVEIVI